MKYAVIFSGGKQYRVSEGQTVKLEKLTAEVGEVVHFEQVLMVANEGKLAIGTPYVKGSLVAAEVVSHGRGKKIRIIKFRRRKHHMKHQGHRQSYTELKIQQIQAA